MTSALLGRLCRSIRGVSAVLFGVGGVLLWLTLVAGTLAFLVWNEPQPLQATRVLVALDPQLKRDDLDVLYLNMREWDEVKAVRFVLDAGDASLPSSVSLPPRTPALLLSLNPGASERQILERVQQIEGVRQTIVLGRGDVPALWVQTQTLKPALLSAFVVLLLASLLALVGGVRRLLQQWRGELELLHLSGVPRRNAASAFAVVGILVAGMGSVLASVVVYGFGVWAQSRLELVRQIFPYALEPERMLGLSLGTLIVGLLVGVVAGTWGSRVRD